VGFRGVIFVRLRAADTLAKATGRSAPAPRHTRKCGCEHARLKSPSPASTQASIKARHDGRHAGVLQIIVLILFAVNRLHLIYVLHIILILIAMIIPIIILVVLIVLYYYS
jgi:hypothetical protein